MILKHLNSPLKKTLTKTLNLHFWLNWIEQQPSKLMVTGSSPVKCIFREGSQAANGGRL